MVNAWVEHVKRFARDNNISYMCAISKEECKTSYRRKNQPIEPPETRTFRKLKPVVLPNPYTAFQKMFDKDSYNIVQRGETTNDPIVNKYNKKGAERYALYLRSR